MTQKKAPIPPQEPAGDNPLPVEAMEPPPPQSISYEVLQPIYGLDAPGVKRMPGYAFEGDPERHDELEQLVKLGYLKHV
jgi:hypothetical protein